MLNPHGHCRPIVSLRGSCGASPTRSIQRTPDTRRACEQSPHAPELLPGQRPLLLRERKAKTRKESTLERRECTRKIARRTCTYTKTVGTIVCTYRSSFHIIAITCVRKCVYTKCIQTSFPSLYVRTYVHIPLSLSRSLRHSYIHERHT